MTDVLSSPRRDRRCRAVDAGERGGGDRDGLTAGAKPDEDEPRQHVGEALARGGGVPEDD